MADNKLTQGKLVDEQIWISDSLDVNSLLAKGYGNLVTAPSSTNEDICNVSLLLLDEEVILKKVQYVFHKLIHVRHFISCAHMKFVSQMAQQF